MPEAPGSKDSICAALGLSVPGVVADHIRPVTGPDDPSFYKYESLQLLCRTCDAAKRQREMIASRSGTNDPDRAGRGGSF
jgi:5-methylcytosine-specific restriction endonuclease McrA